VTAARGPWLYVRDADGMRWVDSADMSSAVMATPAASRKVVVGAMNDTLAVADYEQARRIASAWRALALAETVEDALDRLPEPYRSQVEELQLEAEDDDAPPPNREALHDWAIEGGIEWIEQEMLTTPEEIVDLGEQSHSATTGPCLLIPASRRDEVLATLKAAGYDVVEDDELVWAASPYGYDSASA
jgi:hypothetical protein